MEEKKGEGLYDLKMEKGLSNHNTKSRRHKEKN